MREGHTQEQDLHKKMALQQAAGQIAGRAGRPGPRGKLTRSNGRRAIHCAGSLWVTWGTVTWRIGTRGILRG